MPTVHETAYPRLKSTVTDKELAETYAPIPEELAFAEQHTCRETATVGFLVLLKTFQRLGYFLPLAKVPQRIIYISTSVGLSQRGLTRKVYAISASFSGFRTDSSWDLSSATVSDQ